MNNALLMICLIPLIVDAQPSQWESDWRDGIAAREQGRFTEARSLLESALTGPALGAQDLRRADIAALLVTVYQTLGESQEAERLFLEAQTILDSNHTVDPARGFAILHHLGVFRAAQGRLNDAAALLERALASGVKTFGEKHANTARMQSTLAQIYTAQGRLAEAKPLLGRVVELHQGTVPATNLDRIDAETALGVLYALEGRYPAARQILQRASESARQLGERHPRYADSLVSLADLYRFEGDRTRGEPLLRKALAIYEASLGPECPRVAETLLDVSLDAISERKPALAARQIGRALSILRKTNGPDHTTVAVGEYRLAQAYFQQEKYAEARALLEHALPIQERTYPNGHAVVADCLRGLAEVAAAQRRQRDAELYWLRAISLYEISASPAHPGLAVALQQYARFLRANRLAQAKAVEARARDLLRAAASLK